MRVPEHMFLASLILPSDSEITSVWHKVDEYAVEQPLRENANTKDVKYQACLLVKHQQTSGVGAGTISNGEVGEFFVDTKTLCER